MSSRQAHFLQTRSADTGYPVDNGLASVTIITEEGKRGDALSTSMFVKGLDEASRGQEMDFQLCLPVLCVREKGSFPAGDKFLQLLDLFLFLFVGFFHLADEKLAGLVPEIIVSGPASTWQRSQNSSHTA